MLERKKYEEELDRVRQKEIDDLSNYLENFFKRLYESKECSLNNRMPEEVLEEIKAIPMPRNGRDPKEVGDELVNKVLNYSLILQHPRFYSLVTAAVSPYSLAGAVLTDIYNPNVAGWDCAEGPALIEEKMIKWMGSLAGFDPNVCGGIFTSGGSLSNLTGMIAARETKLPGRFDLPIGVAYLSDQAHSSVRKGLKMLGLREDQIRIIESDENFKIKPSLLEEYIKEDLKNGLKPFLIVGTIGTTNTGTIDPLLDLVKIRDKYNMWLHVDGAYGGSILFSDIYKNLAKGVELADSLSWDTHKWAMQTYSCSCLIARDKQNLINAFNEHPEYLEDVRNANHNDGWDLGIEMSRPARALKLWFTVQAMGTDLISDVIDYSFFNSSIAAKHFAENKDWRIVSKPSCGAVNVRFEPKEIDPSRYDELNSTIISRIIESGYAYVLTTVLKGQKVIRLCVINGNTTTEDVLSTVDKLQEIAEKLKKELIK